MNAPEPITQRPIVRPEYTDPRGKEVYAWADENHVALHKYSRALGIALLEARAFVVVQYETELLRREMQSFERTEQANAQRAHESDRRRDRDGWEGK